MPLPLDFLQDIINVHWGGGGVYVTGSQSFFTNPTSDVWTNKIASKTAALIDWKKTISTPPGNFVASAFPGSAVFVNIGVDKKPMFLIGGGTPAPPRAGIATSKNGSVWTTQTFSKGELYLLTWNESEQALYAGMTDTSDPDDPFVDVALRSTDGLSWEEIGRSSEWEANLVEPYCSDKVTDIHGHNVPTSVFGYDKANDILITPDPVHMTFGVSYPAGEPFQHGDRLKVIRGPGNAAPGSSIKDLPAGMDQVWAVAYGAGIWQAAGQAGAFPHHGVVATSVDDGESWTITLTDVPGSGFANVAAGSIATTDV